MMGDVVARERRFGEGPLARAAARVYGVAVVELLLLLTTVPGLVPLLLLGRDASNVPLAAVCLLPLGPACSAGLYALHHHRADLADLKPAATFWRGYARNLRDVLPLWIPWLAAESVIGVNLTHLRAAGVPGWWAAVLVLAAVAVALWGVNALVISALFAFRARDVAHLAGYFIVRTPGVTLGNAGLLVVAGAVTVLWSEAVVALLGAVFLLALLGTCRPMVLRIEREFTA
jgi:Protein of unknown function, DUF624